MSKHARPTLVLDRAQQAPKHAAGWSFARIFLDERASTYKPDSRHAKPFGKHHPATPVTYNRQGNVTPLRPTQHALDVAA